MTTEGAPVGVVATACAFPAATRTIDEVFDDEHVELSDRVRERLGIDAVHVGGDESGADLALAAATSALAAAGVAAKALDVIIDYTFLPQEFLVPVWNLGNKLQHELGATNAFTLGFSGGGASNFHVALRVGTDLIRANADVRTVLLFGADMAIPANRVINRDDPVTLLGDGASAAVLAAGAEANVILGTEIVSDGANHDVCYIPGGALAQLDDDGQRDQSDRYRLQIDVAKLGVAPMAETLGALAGRVLDAVGAELDDVGRFVVPNVSAADNGLYRSLWDLPEPWVGDANRAGHGHVQATDLVLNLEATLRDGDRDGGELVLVGSHGMGFTAGVALLRH